MTKSTRINFPNGSHIVLGVENLVVRSYAPAVPGYVVDSPVDGSSRTVTDEAIERAILAGELSYLGNSKASPHARSNVAQPITSFPRKDIEEISRRMRYCLTVRRAGCKRSRNAVADAIRDVPPRDREVPSAATVLEWLAILDENHGHPNSLRPGHYRCGNRKSRLLDFVKDAIERAIDECRNFAHGSIADLRVSATQIAMANLPVDLRPYELATVAADGTRTVGSKIPRKPDGSVDQEKLVSYGAVYDAWYKRTGFERCVRTEGSRKARRRFAPALAGPHVTNILERCEIDHTLLDFEVVDTETWLPLGKPWFSVLLDCASRAVLAMRISFEGPSQETNAQILKEAILPKDLSWMGTRPDGSPYALENWPMFGVPMNAFTDQGADLLSASFEDACFRIGTTLIPLPPGRPDLKGTIESFNRRIKKSEIGYLFETKDLSLEGKDRARSDEAVRDREERLLTLHQLRILVTTWLLDDYHASPHHELGRPPRDVWFEKVASLGEGGIEFPPSRDEILLLVGNTKLRTIRREGVKIFGLRYNSVELAAFNRTLGGIDGRTEAVTIKYDPADISHIWVLAEDPDRIPGRSMTLRVPCIHQEYARGLSKHAHEVIARHAKETSEVGHLSYTQLIESKLRLRAIAKEMLADAGRNRGRARLAKFEGIGRGRLTDANDHHDPAASREAIFDGDDNDLDLLPRSERPVEGQRSEPSAPTTDEPASLRRDGGVSGEDEDLGTLDD